MKPLQFQSSLEVHKSSGRLISKEATAYHSLAYRSPGDRGKVGPASKFKKSALSQVKSNAYARFQQAVSRKQTISRQKMAELAEQKNPQTRSSK